MALGDAFLHIGALQSAGFETVPPGAKLKVSVGNGMKGMRRSRASSRWTPQARPSGLRSARPSVPTAAVATAAARSAAPPIPSTAVEVSAATSNGFDDNKGFGFVQSNDGGKDVFVHISILGPSGIQHLAEGQAVNMRVVDTPKGREALSISLA